MSCTDQRQMRLQGSERKKVGTAQEGIEMSISEIITLLKRCVTSGGFKKCCVGRHSSLLLIGSVMPDLRTFSAKACVAGLVAADLLPEMFGGSILLWQLLRQFHGPSMECMMRWVQSWQKNSLSLRDRIYCSFRRFSTFSHISGELRRKKKKDFCNETQNEVARTFLKVFLKVLVS